MNKTIEEDLKAKIVELERWVELYKAQADGKVIEQTYYSEGCKEPVGWFVNENWDGIFRVDVSRYRIKPDKHTFKVGDWVKPPNEDYQRVYKITDKSIHITDFRDINTSIGINTNTYSKLELWKPTEGEWCVFCQGDNPFNTYRVAQYYSKNIKNGYYMIQTYDNASEGYKCIYPLEFVNTLKDK